MRMGDGSLSREMESISTGSIGLDAALGIGGLPKGRVVEIYGPESSGKTTLTLQVLAESQKIGGTVAFIDAEHALDPGYAEKLGVSGRYDLLAPVIDKDFDLQRMIRVTAGKFWRQADGASRAKALAAFRRMSIATYAAQFDGWSGQTFTTIASRPGPQRTVLVQTKISAPGGDGAALTYVLKERTRGNGEWRIVDVLLDGFISQLAVRRSEYQRVLKSNGLPGLIKVLDAKAGKLLAG